MKLSKTPLSTLNRIKNTFLGEAPALYDAVGKIGDSYPEAFILCYFGTTLITNLKRWNALYGWILQSDQEIKKGET